jgi:hypothetical protein
LAAASAEPRAAELLDTFLRTRLLGPLLGQLGSNRPELRGDLAVSQLIGLGMTRYILRFEPLASASSDNVVSWIGPTLQRYLAGKL